MNSPAASSMRKPPTSAIATACAAPKSRKASRPLRKSASRGFDDASFGLAVMAGLDPAIHVFFCFVLKTWMPGTSPGMTTLIFVEPLSVDESHRIGDARPCGPVAVDLVSVIGIAERDAADHAAVIGQLEVTADQFRMPRQRGLRDRPKPKRLGRQHEIADIGAAVDRAINAERLVGVDDRDMRRAEEIVVLQRLFGVGRLVAPDNAERVVELKAALATAREIDAEVLPRRREIMAVLGAGSGFRVDQFAKTFLGLAAHDHNLPRLAVAPRRRALRHGKHVLDGVARHRLRQAGTNGIAFVQEFPEHADAFLGPVT